MKYLRTTLIFALSYFAASHSFAQPGPGRPPALTVDEGALLGVKVTLNQAYGSHQRQVLDIYQPEHATEEAMPIVFMIHGGGFIGGDKSVTRNIVSFLARNGMIGITVNYRLPPEHTWPSGAEDIASIVRWIQENGAALGGDADNVFIMGHSAGAGHAASYVFFEEFQVKNDGIAGAILVSGPTYDLALVLDKTGTKLGFHGEEAYFGSDLSTYANKSSTANIAGRKIPILIAFAEHDTSNILIENAALIAALYERDKKLPTIIQGIGHHHFSVLGHINSYEESAANLRAFSSIYIVCL